VQLLFKGVVQYYVRQSGVVIDEVELSRGPVDFIFTHSVRNRVLLEIRKMNNSKYWDELESQLTSYIKSDGCRRGWLLAVRYSDSEEIGCARAISPSALPLRRRSQSSN
jgi:hypothetical protein